MAAPSGLSVSLAGVTLAVTTVIAVPAPARGEDLRQALVEGYQNNPVLNQQRAQQRAVDEQVPQAKVGLQPTIGLSATGAYNRTYNPQSFAAPETNSGSTGLYITQPLYTGGRTAAAVRAAEASVRAGAEGLRSTEAQVLAAVVQAYENVRRDMAVVAVWKSDVEFLRRQLQEIKARQEVGDATRTDVAQAEAQLLDSRSSMAQAQGQLEVDRADYAAIVGHMPGTLSPEPPLPGLPATIDAAFDLVEANNPTVSQAHRAAEASSARVAQAQAGARPTITAQTVLGADGGLVPAYARRYERTVQAGVVVNLPIFSGGQTASLIRQAKAEENRDRIGIEVARRNAIRAAAQAWSQMLANQNDLDTRSAQVKAAAATLEGQQQEYRGGLRSTLEVLNAEQTLRQARISEIVARSQLYLAKVDVLAAIGRMEIRYLAPDTPIYDPARAYRKVKNARQVPWTPALRALDAVVK